MTRVLAVSGTVVIGSWPRQPGIAELANLTDLQAGFPAAATAWLAECLGGTRARSLTGL